MGRAPKNQDGRPRFKVRCFRVKPGSLPSEAIVSGNGHSWHEDSISSIPTSSISALRTRYYTVPYLACQATLKNTSRRGAPLWRPSWAGTRPAPTLSLDRMGCRILVWPRAVTKPQEDIRPQSSPWSDARRASTSHTSPQLSKAVLGELQVAPEEAFGAARSMCGFDADCGRDDRPRTTDGQPQGSPPSAS
jgi:hypothetical protein